MKTKFGIFLGLLFVLSAFKSISQTPIDSLKVLTYNIWNGFDWGKDTVRESQFVKWVQYQDPDVCALQELCGFDSVKLANIAREWNHPYAIILKTGGYPVGITSKYPINLKERIRSGMHHGALHATITGIHFFVIHFSPSSFVKRRWEANRIIEKIKPLGDTTPVIVLGDFNALSPMDAHLYPEGSPVLARYRRNHPSGDKGNLEDMQFDYAVIARFLGYPLYDLAYKFQNEDPDRGTFPALALSHANQETHQLLQARQQRIDYIFATRNLANHCISATVIKNQYTEPLSDHYPVIAEFKFHR